MRIPLIILTILSAAFLLSIAGYYHHRHTTVLPRGYAAWVKHTGNPGDLTYEEWYYLREAQQSHSTTQVISYR